MPDATLAVPAPQAWFAPQAPGPLHATVHLPGSKSLTTRALVLAALADSPTTLTGYLTSRDTELMRQALTVLGASFDADDATATMRVTPAPLPLHVTPSPAGLPEAARAAGAVARIDCGLAGTVMRFLPPLLALADAPVLLDGDDAARRRPLAGLLDTLAALAGGGGLGARRTFLGEPGFLPVVISPARADDADDPDSPMPLTIDSSASSQFLSALLLGGCLLPGGAAVTATGTVPSLPHVEMTAATLRERGIKVTASHQASDGVGSDQAPGHGEPADGTTWIVAPGRPAGGTWAIEPDLSNAGPFLAAALVAGGSVSVPGWPVTTTQAGDAWRWLLPALGGTVAMEEAPEGTGVLTASGTGQLTGIDADLGQVGELAPTVTALATLASAQGHGSRLRGIGHLRGHETDRLAALVAEITRLGGHAQVTADGIQIDPLGPGEHLHPACLRTYTDHRMATFAAVIGLGVPGVELDDVACTSKTLPDFPGMWTAVLGAGTRTTQPDQEGDSRGEA